jgi:hypothetical protein
MKINEILIPNEMDIQAYAKTLQLDCAPYLANYSQPVYRGIGLNSVSVEFGEYPCPRNRKPRNSDPLVSEIADDWFQANFGIKFRSNAVFATGSAKEAAGYGPVYELFPAGQYVFCWSERVTDFTFEISDQITEVGMTPLQDDDPDAEHTVVSMLDICGYTTSNWDEAVRSNNEIMIHCEGYFAVARKIAEQIKKYIL